jgi:hypothetical protein
VCVHNSSRGVLKTGVNHPKVSSSSSSNVSMPCQEQYCKPSTTELVAPCDPASRSLTQLGNGCEWLWQPMA